jgi:hypothetical protein
LETLYGLFKAIQIKFNLALAQENLSNEILGWQEPDKTMMFLTVRIQDDDRRRPFHRIPFHQCFVFVKIDLKRNKVIFHGKTDIGIGISNSCQLLASNSEIIIKIYQDKLLFLSCLCLRCRQRGLPLNLFTHNAPSFHHREFLNPGARAHGTPRWMIRSQLWQASNSHLEKNMRIDHDNPSLSKRIKISLSLLDSPDQFSLGKFEVFFNSKAFTLLRIPVFSCQPYPLGLLKNQKSYLLFFSEARYLSSQINVT